MHAIRVSQVSDLRILSSENVSRDSRKFSELPVSPDFDGWIEASARTRIRSASSGRSSLSRPVESVAPLTR